MLLLFIALSSLYYYKEKNRYFQEKKTVLKIEYNECVHLNKIINLESECSMKKVSIDEKLMIIYKEILFAFVMALLFILPLAYYLARLSLLPVRESVETMDNFINGIVHDINTPLSVIRINAQSMNKRLDNELMKEKNRRVIEATEHIEALEEQLLFMLRIHQYTPQKEHFSLSSKLEERAGYYSDIRQSVKVKIEVQNIEIYADKYAVIRMIDNIVINAVKYSQAKNEVIIRCEDAVLTIQDYGIGIKAPKEVFNKYYRESKETKGLGLGLYVVQEIANMHDLEIQIESEIGVGTTFTINLSSLTTA